MPCPAITSLLDDEHDPAWLAQQANDPRDGVLLSTNGALPEDGMPASLVQRALARSSAGMATRCPPQGVLPLRERIAALMQGQGLHVDAGRLLTTCGGTQAIDLLCRAFVRPGDKVLVEDPGYFLLFGRLRETGARIVSLARRHDGIDLDQLDSACRAHRPRLLFSQTVLHNPTGWGSTPANAQGVLSLARKHGVLIAEDDVQGHFHPGTPPRLAQLSGLDGVVYYSSFCKALSPALRLGYMAAEPALLKPLLRQKIYSVLTTPSLNEFVLLECLSAGRCRKHLDRLQARLTAARAASARQLRRAGVLLEHPAEGGLFLWGSLPHGTDVDALVQDAWRHGTLLARGASFNAASADTAHLRFNVVYSQQPRLAAYLAKRLTPVIKLRVSSAG